MLDLLPVMEEVKSPRGLWGCWKERRLNTHPQFSGRCSERYTVPLRKPNPARSLIAARAHISAHLGQERPWKLDKPASTMAGQGLALPCNLKGAVTASPPQNQS